jgi:hypothetical protein
MKPNEEYLLTKEAIVARLLAIRAWRCRYARHSYRFIRGPENWLPEADEQSRLRRLSRRLLCITDIALIQTAKPPDHRET